MGLDTVELLMDVEEVFGIKIPDEEAHTLEGVGELHELILSSMKQTETEIGLTSLVNAKLCEGLHALKISRHFDASSRVNHLFPLANRRSCWAQLSSETDLKLPRLK